LFYSDKSKLDFKYLSSLIKQVRQLAREGKQVVIVSSGAIALGMESMGIKVRPKDLPSLQALAAIGQSELMNQFRYFFNFYGKKCAQVLLTWEDFDDRQRYLNAKNSLLKLLDMGCIPVVNENDTISTDEIKFGDNDRLSALVATLVSADLLVMLSDVDGLLDKEKRVVKVIDEITPEIRALASCTNKQVCVGGMVTKIDAAKIAVNSGIACIIANGRRNKIVLSAINDPEDFGTLFVAKQDLTAKERWIAFGTKTRGSIIVDEGAKKALLNNKSLLSVGVTGVEGNFASGEIVSIKTGREHDFARGKTQVSSRQLEAVKGARSEKEVIHRDNIVIL
jgi:glutamate 5-kinase